MTKRRGRVFFRDVFSGYIYEDENGYVFQYDAKYVVNSECPAISFTLPKREEAFHSKVLFPFFDGLIPEGWLFGLAQAVWKFDRKDRFGFLLSVCKDCIGAVSIEGEES